MKIQAILIVTLLALLPLLQAKPMSTFKERALVDMLTAMMQEENMDQEPRETIDQETANAMQVVAVAGDRML